MQDQQMLWDAIAPEWEKLKKPNDKTLLFIQPQKGNFLDLGCGSGRHIIPKKDLNYFGVDFSSEMLKRAKKKAKKLNINAKFKQAEVSQIPYEDNFFDAALYEATLHCILDDNKRHESLKELFRVMKPGAKAKLTVWNKDAKRFRKKQKKDTVKWTTKGPREYYFYTRDEIKEELKTVGFEIIQENDPELDIALIIKKPEI